jgi:uncharacterized repeat protein (TIGR03803 family)
MQNRSLSLEWMAAAIIAVCVLATATRSAAQQETVLYNFGNGADTSAPEGNLTVDSAGNFYGTSDQGGGTYGGGTVFELTRNADGTWANKILHSFGNGNDGSRLRSGVIFDTAGHLFGTTIEGGAHNQGTVFEMTRRANGIWAEKILHSFNGTDGINGWDKLTFDASGNMFSTTAIGGNYGQGTLYEMMPKAGGGWTFKVLHHFGNGHDGAQPQGGLILDTAGNLYGATTYGGRYGVGTVFEFSPKAGGGWIEKLLYSFKNNGVDGGNPFSSVIFGADGNLYGDTYFGGAVGSGTVYELTHTSGGGWTETTLYNFPNNLAADGSNPQTRVTFDAAGNLYGSAGWGGGIEPGAGTIFKMTPTAGGTWNYEVLHNFNDSATDGYRPSFCEIVFDSSGNLYGLTGQGGTYGTGTFYQIAP